MNAAKQRVIDDPTAREAHRIGVLEIRGAATRFALNRPSNTACHESDKSEYGHKPPPLQVNRRDGEDLYKTQVLQLCHVSIQDWFLPK